MRNHHNSRGNLLSLLVFQQRVRSVISLGFHLHVQQEEDWDWPFINNITPPLCRFHFLTWQRENRAAVDQPDLTGNEAAQDIKLSLGKGGGGVGSCKCCLLWCFDVYRSWSRVRRSRDRWSCLLQDEREHCEVGQVDSHAPQTETLGLLRTHLWSHPDWWIKTNVTDKWCSRKVQSAFSQNLMKV